MAVTNRAGKFPQHHSPFPIRKVIHPTLASPHKRVQADRHARNPLDFLFAVVIDQDFIVLFLIGDRFSLGPRRFQIGRLYGHHRFKTRRTGFHFTRTGAEELAIDGDVEIGIVAGGYRFETA